MDAQSKTGKRGCPWIKTYGSLLYQPLTETHFQLNLGQALSSPGAVPAAFQDQRGLGTAAFLAGGPDGPGDLRQIDFYTQNAGTISIIDQSMSLPSCLICGRGLKPVLTQLSDDRFYSPGTYDILRCWQCGLEQTWPQPNATEIGEIYRRYYNRDCEKAETYTIIRRRFINSSWYPLWLKLGGDVCFHLRQGKGRLLDIGCNEGRGLGFYSQNGFQPEGLEINEKAAAVARERGFMVHTVPLEQVNPLGLFDVIVLSNALEHASDPLGMLKHVHRLLQPNGQVWISCPNADSLWRYRLGRHWINWHVPFHLWHFSPKSLEAMLTSAQFQIMEMQTFTPAIWTAQGLSLAMGRRLNLSNRLYRSAAVITALTITMRLLLPLIRENRSSLSGDCLIITARASA